MKQLNKNEPQTIFSACNGISTGLNCLKKMGVNITKYLSTEIDPHAIAVSKHNHPEDYVVQLGDLNKVTLDDIKDTTLWLSSTPCTNISSINAKKEGIYGAGSNLFFKSVELMNELNEYRKSIGKDKVPFLYENVASASPADIQIMNETLGVKGTKLNSKLVSGNLRNRIYHCSWKVEQPKDLQIKFQDVVEDGWVLKEKANALLTGSPSLTATSLKRMLYMSIGNLVFTNKEFSTLPKDEMLDEFNRITDFGELKENIPFRKLTINEMEALMTLPKGYVDDAPISQTQKIKCIGNGWTADIISHILTGIFK
jgi:site-specific DNA-cytosine methylase